MECLAGCAELTGVIDRPRVSWNVVFTETGHSTVYSWLCTVLAWAVDRAYSLHPYFYMAREESALPHRLPFPVLSLHQLVAAR